MNEIVLEIPSWLSKLEARKEFFRFLMGETQIKVEYYRSLMKPFERKYSTSFKDFKKQVESSKQEDFQAWDDLIEWEAYFRANGEWSKKYEELQDVRSNNLFTISRMSIGKERK